MIAGAAGLDPALCIAVPVGHGLEEVRQLVGSNEGASRKADERQNKKKILTREGKTFTRAPVQPPREECEREYRTSRKRKQRQKATKPNQPRTPEANFN